MIAVVSHKRMVLELRDQINMYRVVPCFVSCGRIQTFAAKVSFPNDGSGWSTTTMVDGAPSRMNNHIQWSTWDRCDINKKARNGEGGPNTPDICIDNNVYN